MTYKQQIVKFFRHLGYDLTRYSPSAHADARRMRQIETYGIDLILDVGANYGGYGKELRLGGYKGRIVSFEPLASVYSTLAESAHGDDLWQTMHCALGAEAGGQTIHVAANTTSSSLLDMLPAHKDAAPDACYVGEETIQVETLDGLYEKIFAGAKSIWLKIDTQGFEKQVLDGAVACLHLIDTVQIEVSFTPLYDGSATYLELIQFMESRGYDVTGMEPGFCNPDTGRLLQADFTFHRFTSK